jgi:hypothetical protein
MFYTLESSIQLICNSTIAYTHTYIIYYTTRTTHKQEVAPVKASAGDAAPSKESKSGHYVGIHASGFKDFLLKPELLRAIVDAGFEHPSEVQHESIPQAVLGGDIVCQAKSGMGKTAGTLRVC